MNSYSEFLRGKSMTNIGAVAFALIFAIFVSKVGDIAYEYEKIDKCVRVKNTIVLVKK